MTATTQGSAPANAPATPAAAAPPAKKPDLDEFLREFDTSTQPPAKPAAPAAAAAPATAPAAAPAPNAEIDRRLAPIEAELQQSRQERTQRDIDAIVESVRDESDFLKGVDSDVVYGFLQGLGARDPRFRAAFMQRNQKPDQWANVLRAAAAKLEEKLRPVASAPSAQGRAAVLAAARQTATAPATPATTQQEVRRMSDRDFNRWKQQQKAAARR